MEANSAKLFYSQLYFLNHRLSTLDGLQMDSVTTAFLTEILELRLRRLQLAMI
jgi:hypothetical protein